MTQEPPHHSQPEDPAGPQSAERFWNEFGRASARASSRAPKEERRQHSGNGGSINRGPLEGGHECLEWCPICRSADVLRAGTPPELRGQLQRAQRDALVSVRALLDAYIERLERAERARSRTVEDIPIS